MNYQHAFHAGNFADVHKHAVLTRILVRLREKPAAFRVIDTHAGAGRYDLFSTEASRGGEWQSGVKLVWAMRDTCAGDSSTAVNGAAAGKSDAAVLLMPYLQAVGAFNPGGVLRVYPGSPRLALELLRTQDRLIACEMEPRAAAALKATLRGDGRAKALAIDGWTALSAYVPPKERRGLILIDPPFEDAGDFSRLTTAVAAAHRKWPTGIYLLWYPIKERAAPDALARRLRKLAVPSILRSELMLGAPRGGAGLVGSGLIVINPPYRLEAELATLVPALGRIMAASACRLDWLAARP